jgi:hypothetical protein
MTKDEALKLALDVLLEMSPSGPIGSDIWQKQMSAITTIAKALAQPAQEPVAQYSDIASDGGLDPRNQFDAPQRPWIGLTDEEIREIHSASRGQDVGVATGLIEAKLKEKNT